MREARMRGRAGGGTGDWLGLLQCLPVSVNIYVARRMEGPQGRTQPSATRPGRRVEAPGPRADPWRPPPPSRPRPRPGRPEPISACRIRPLRLAPRGSRGRSLFNRSPGDAKAGGVVRGRSGAVLGLDTRVSSLLPPHPHPARPPSPPRARLSCGKKRNARVPEDRQLGWRAARSRRGTDPVLRRPSAGEETRTACPGTDSRGSPPSPGELKPAPGGVIPPAHRPCPQAGPPR